MFTVGQAQDAIDRINQNTDRVNFNNGQQNLGNSKITKDGFMQLMLAQLKQQDPTDPVSDKEFVQQQAALTQIEKLDELSKTLKQTSQLSQAATLTGRYITVVGGDQVETTGKVSQVVLADNTIGVQVNGKSYSADQIKTLYDGTPPTVNNLP